MERPYVSRLLLTDFRSYARAELRLERGPAVLVGPNGAGKTNLLEALSFLSPGRGLRGVKASEAARHGAQGPWAVAASLSGVAAVPVELGTGLVPGGERRTVRRDGRTVAQTALGRDLALLWLTPLMDRLWVEGTGGRRRFLDRLVLALDPAHAERTAAYDRARLERLNLLRPGGPRPDPQWLDVLEARLAQEGTAMAAARIEAVAALNRAGERTLGTFPRARLGLAGVPEDWLAQGQAPTPAQARLAQALKAARERDGEAGAQGTGPHRSDFLVAMAAGDKPAAQCSTGEQKALLLSIVLGQARLVAERRGATAILLLDEVAAHLDPGRRAALYEELSGLDGQIFLTGTEDALFDGLKPQAQFFDVGGAQARPRQREAVR